VSELDTLHVAFGRLIREPLLRARFEANPDEVLGELGLDEADRAAMLAHGPRRVLAYGQMVFGRLYRTLFELMPRTSKLLEPHGLGAELRTWVTEVGPRSPYLLELPSEFLAWVRPRWLARIGSAEHWPAWLLELAEHELLIPAVRHDHRDCGGPSAHAIELERGLASNPTARLITRRFAVHRLPAKLPTPLPQPDEGDFVLVAWRDAGDRVQVLELEPRAAALLERLLAGQTLREALFGACAAVGETLDDGILQSTALTLADWCDRHLLLGGAPD
jgi:hypothetical protein